MSPVPAIDEPACSSAWVPTRRSPGSVSPTSSTEIVPSVAGDTGPLHLAAALGRPAVAIFGPKDPRVYGPYGCPSAIVRKDLDCSPCTRRRCDDVRCLLEIRSAVDGPDFDAALDKVYPGLEKISIDYGVMEKAEGGLVAAVSYAWDDVGSWRALERLLPADALGNHVQGECTSIEAKNNIVSAQGASKLVSGVHGGGSPIMEEIAIYGNYDIESKKRIAEELAGIQDNK